MIGTLFLFLVLWRTSNPYFFLEDRDDLRLIPLMTPAVPLFASVLLREAASSQEGLPLALNHPPSLCLTVAGDPSLSASDCHHSDLNNHWCDSFPKASPRCPSPLIYMDLSLSP